MDMSNEELQDSNRNYSATSLEKMIETYRTGVKRINSEDEFLRLLNKIPSAHNLMGYGTGQNVQQLNSEQLSHLAQLRAHSSLLANSPPPIATELPQHKSLEIDGIPRVGSLDFLHQIMGKASETTMPRTLAKEGPVDQQNGGDEALQIHPQHLSSLPVSNPVTAPSPEMSARDTGAPTATMQSGSEDNNNSTEPSSSRRRPARELPAYPPYPGRGRPQKESLGKGVKEGMNKVEMRRARRMLSNRESARRSRKRKQEHLGNLEEQIASLEADKEHMAHQIDRLERSLAAAQAEIASLKADRGRE